MNWSEAYYTARSTRVMNNNWENQGYPMDSRGVTRTPSASYNKHDWLKSRMNKNRLSVFLNDF